MDDTIKVADRIPAVLGTDKTAAFVATLTQLLTTAPDETDPITTQNQP